MDKFEQYKELQNLLETMNTSEEVSKVKDYIDEHQLLANEKRANSTLMLIGSVVYIRPQLLKNAISLLNSYETIPISDEIDTILNVEHKEIIYRRTVLMILLSMSKHKVTPKGFFYYEKYINPIDTLKDDQYYYYKNFDIDTISKMTNEQKIEARNALHSINPLVQLIKEDKINEFQDFISKNNYNIENEIPQSHFEMHQILFNAKPIEYAAFFGSINIFKFLLNKDNNINFGNLLEYAIAGGNIDIIHIIENESHDDDIKSNQRLLELAILYMNNELIEYIVHSYPVKIDAESYIKCIYASNYDAALKLKELDDDPNTINEFGDIGSTPIDIAAFEGYVYFIKFFLTFKNIDAKIYNSYGKTIFQSAARGNRKNAAKYIIKHKLVDKNDCGDYGLSPLDIAYDYNCRHIIDLLDRDGEDENENNNEE